MNLKPSPKVLKLIRGRQRASARQEERIAADHAGRRVAGSGSQSFNKGDVKLDKWLVEAKMTRGVRFSLTLELFRKIEGEARRRGRLPAMFIEMAGRTLVVIREDDFAAVRNLV